MFSNSLKYLIKALSFLATYSDADHKFKIGEIADKCNVPAPYLGKLLQPLSKKGIVSSTKGPNGGFYLSNDNRKIKLEQVVFLIDGNEKYRNCLLSFEKCNADNPCPLHHLYEPLKSNFLWEMKSICIADLMDPNLSE